MMLRLAFLEKPSESSNRLFSVGNVEAAQADWCLGSAMPLARPSSLSYPQYFKNASIWLRQLRPCRCYIL